MSLEKSFFKSLIGGNKPENGPKMDDLDSAEKATDIDKGRLTLDESLLYQGKATGWKADSFSDKPRKEGGREAQELIDDLKGCELGKFIDWQRAEKEGDIQAQIDFALVTLSQEDEEKQRANFGEKHPSVFSFLKKHKKIFVPVLAAGIIGPFARDIVDGVSNMRKEADDAFNSASAVAVNQLDSKQLTEMRFGAYAQAAQDWEAQHEGFKIQDIKVTPDFRVPGKSMVYIQMLVKTPDGKDWLVQKQTPLYDANAKNIIASVDQDINSAQFKKNMVHAVGVGMQIHGVFKTIDGISEAKLGKTAYGVAAIGAGEVVKHYGDTIVKDAAKGPAQQPGGTAVAK